MAYGCLFIEKPQNKRKTMSLKDSFVGIRLTKDELKKLDKLAQGQLNRSQVVRLVLLEFLARSEEEQKEVLFKSLFSE